MFKKHLKDLPDTYPAVQKEFLPPPRSKKNQPNSIESKQTATARKTINETKEFNQVKTQRTICLQLM